MTPLTCGYTAATLYTMNTSPNAIHDFSPLNDARPCDFSPGIWPDSLIKMVVDGRSDVGTFNGRAWPRAMVSAAIREMGRRHAMLSL